VHVSSSASAPSSLPPAPLSSRPLLKWAGGKRQLLGALSAHYPQQYERYVEPFFGSGAVFFDLHASGALDGRAAMLADVNPDLVGCYRTVRDRTDEVIAALRRLDAEYRDGGADVYYDVRDRRFNPLRAEMAATAHDARRVAAAYTPALAAMVIFLNRTGFNGLFRLNRGGGFNVPAGRYTNPRICDADHVRSVAAAFTGRRVTIDCVPFDEVLADAGEGDFVYCDPPYAPLSRTASFAHYSAGGFTTRDQQRLQQAVVDAACRGAHIVLSNSSAPEIVELYSAPAVKNAGLTLHLVEARRAINSRATARGPIHEVIVTNAARRAGVILPKKLPMAKVAPRAAKRRSA
jgi:DNA adenine methylase